MTRTARGEAGYDATPAGTGPSPADGAAKSADGVTKSADPGTPSADAATLPPDAGAPPAGVEPPSPGVAAGAAGGDAPPPDELPPEPPPMTAGERLRTARMLVVGAVVMWVVLVAAWAGNRALETWASAERNRRAEAARARLADGAELSGVFNEVNAVVEPSVVKIDVLRPTPAPPRPVPGRPEPLPPANSGSGVIVDVDDGAGLTGGLRTPVGYVVTNEHVVRNASAIFVTLFDGRRITARVVGTDPPTDLAVLRVEATGLLPARWGDSDGLRKGDAVLAFGSPFGFVGSMTSGIVSALNRTSDDGVGAPPPAAAGSDAPTPYRDFIQVDAAVNPGNSGGPLADVRGRIVGINTSIFTRTGDFSGIGFAIPSNQARARLRRPPRPRAGRFAATWASPPWPPRPGRTWPGPLGFRPAGAAGRDRGRGLPGFPRGRGRAAARRRHHRRSAASRSPPSRTSATAPPSPAPATCSNSTSSAAARIRA